MCEPVLTGLAVASAIGGTAQNLTQQRANQKAAEQFQRQQQVMQDRISRQAAAANIASLQARFRQESEQEALEIELNARRAIEARGTATVAAGEAGALGPSFEALISKFAREESEFRTAQLQRRVARRQQLVLEQKGVHTTLQGRLLAAIPQPIQRPDYLGASLRALGTSSQLIASQIRADRLARKQRD